MGRPTDFTSELACIYGLFDSTGALRYVGKARDAKARLKDHMRECRGHRRRTPLYDWLRKHGVPEMRLLEADCVDWREAERRHISEARARGERLLNIADGGDQPHCPAEIRARNGAANAAAIHGDPLKKRIWNAKRALAQGLRQGMVMNSTRAKMREAAHRLPHLFGEWATIPDREERAYER
ncbi:MAG: GIY-YIG nuclease family protein [Sphingomonas sp.]|uniref:GIY-YIG nuclease family protein n=1 Tax=Sphingomonas sp. TaxID=28214 RepID=UPI001AFF1A38|nr:GIY-YIG nuclease family protein [Sphingomonas sp.]MBO9624156.1 GIY-YIG nuclease family protein [Sphingomonas sp.]